MTLKQRWLLILLASINFTHILDFMIMMPLGSYLIPELHITPQFFSWIVAAYPIAAFFSGSVTAFYVDRFDRKKVLLFSYFGFIAGTLCCGFASSAPLLLTARVLTGLFGGLIGAQILAIVADRFDYQVRGRAMGAVFASMSVASVFGVPFSLYLASSFSWNAPFIFIGILGLMVAIFLIYFMPPMNKHLQQQPDEYVPVRQVFKEMIDNRGQGMALTLSAMLMLGHFLIIPFITPYLEFNVGFTKEQTPVIYMVGGICALITSFIAGRLSDKYGKLQVFLVCGTGSLVPILLLTNLPAMPFYLVLVIFGFYFTFSSGRNIPAQALITNVVQPAQRGRFMSFTSSLQQLFSGIASVVAGLMVTTSADGKLHHYELVGYLSVAIMFSTLFIARKLARH